MAGGTWWKVLGLAGAVGVTASGVLAVRHQRQRSAYTADEVRDRLHTRLAELDGLEQGEPSVTT
jgi:hypothetical protein